MRNKFLTLICLLLAAVLLFGACAQKESKDDAIAGKPSDIADTFVVATVNDEPIYYSQFYPRFSATCQQYGIDENDPAYSENIKSHVLEMLVEEKIMLQALTEKGYMDFSDAVLARINEDTQGELDMLVDMYYGDTIDSELGENPTDDQYAQAKARYEEEMLSEFGMTKEDLINYYKKMQAEETAMEDLLGSIEPTDAQIKAKYDENVAYDKDTLSEDASVYEGTVKSGRTIYYTPEGVRRVRHVLIGFDDDASDAISLLRSNEFDTAADTLRDISLETIKADADAVLEKLTSKELSFEDAIKEYGDDPGQTEEGYTVWEGNEIFVKEFTEASMALDKKGDITALVPTDFGYHIIEYFGDVESGAISFDSVKDEIHELLISSLKDEKWQQILDEWRNAAVVVYTEQAY